MGRWPELAGHPDGGYAEIDSSTARSFTASDLPPGDWTGAVARIKGQRWFLLNREVVGDTGSTLQLHPGPQHGDLRCMQVVGSPPNEMEVFGNDCAGYGYYLTDHLDTLDREGEWFYDRANREVFLFTLGGAPAEGAIEASWVEPDSPSKGAFKAGILLGERIGVEVDHVTIEDLRIERWFDHGIALEENTQSDEPDGLVIRNNEIVDVDDAGIHLGTWPACAPPGAPNPCPVPRAPRTPPYPPSGSGAAGTCSSRATSSTARTPTASTPTASTRRISGTRSATSASSRTSAAWGWAAGSTGTRTPAPRSARACASSGASPPATTARRAT